MSVGFYNDCDLGYFADHKDADTADRWECPTCLMTFIYDGERWRNVLEIGQRKVDKLMTIGRVRLLTRGME